MKTFKSISHKVFKGVNFKRFSFFFIASCLFLMLSKLSEVYTETILYPVKIANYPEDLQFVKDTSLKLRVRLKSTGFRLLPLLFKKSDTLILSAQKDVKQVDSKSEFVWNAGNAFDNLKVHLPSYYEVLNVEPDSLFFKYETLSSRQFKIALNSNISYAIGFDVVRNMNLSQDSVKVIGPVSVLDTLSGITTELVELKNLKTKFSLPVALNNPDPQILKLSPGSIELSADVRRFTEGEVSVPLTLINKPDNLNINYFPKQLSLTYYVDLESFKTITAEDFEIVIDYNEYLNNSDNVLTPKVKRYPETIKSVRLSKNRIDFIIL